MGEDESEDDLEQTESDGECSDPQPTFAEVSSNELLLNRESTSLSNANCPESVQSFFDEIAAMDQPDERKIIRLERKAHQELHVLRNKHLKLASRVKKVSCRCLSPHSVTRFQGEEGELPLFIAAFTGSSFVVM